MARGKIHAGPIGPGKKHVWRPCAGKSFVNRAFGYDELGLCAARKFAIGDRGMTFQVGGNRRRDHEHSNGTSSSYMRQSTDSP